MKHEFADGKEEAKYGEDSRFRLKVAVSEDFEEGDRVAKEGEGELDGEHDEFVKEVDVLNFILVDSAM